MLLADALEGIPRTDYLLATKYQPRFPNGTMLMASDVEAAIERSLGRLRTDVIDVYQVHALKAADFDEVAETHLPVLLHARDAGRSGPSVSPNRSPATIRVTRRSCGPWMTGRSMS